MHRIRTTCRRKSYSPSTEKAYASWIKRFIVYHEWKHPEDMGADEVRAYLEYLASARNVAASTQNQALNALVFLYDKVLLRDLDSFQSFIRARKPKRLPVVLNPEEVQLILGLMDGQSGLIARMLYGT